MKNRRESTKKHLCTTFDLGRYNYCCIPIPPGFLLLVFNSTGILQVSLYRDYPGVIDERLQRKNLPWPGLMEDIAAYFKGDVVSFNYPLIMEGYSSFVQKILQLTRWIPYGQVFSYGELARKAGHPKAARAVGQALGENRTPILIPCHRVVKKDGALGGFSTGISWKRELLNLEKVSGMGVSKNFDS